MLKLGELMLSKESILDFEFGKTSDRVDVLGDLVLDGILNVYDSEEFQIGDHVLFTYGGELTDRGLELGFAPSIFTYRVEPRVVGNSKALFLVVNEVPEPGVMAVAAGEWWGWG